MSFEKSVLEALELLGFKVERNKHIQGCQIDLFAVYRTGPITIRWMVECKERKTGDIDSDTVRDFYNVLNPARPAEVDRGLMVTTHGFTKSAKEYAAKAGIELVTLRQLSTELVDFSGYIDSLISNFEASEDFRYYIDPIASDFLDAISRASGSTDDQIDRTNATSPQDPRVRDESDPSLDFQGTDGSAPKKGRAKTQLTTVLDEALRNGSRIAVLGDFGSGKTTFVRRYAYELAKRYRDDQTSRVPIVYNLRDYHSGDNINQAIFTALQCNDGVQITLAMFLRLQRLGRLVFLLDGFDEMSSQVDVYTPAENVRNLAPLLQVSENKVMLTCRTGFFRDQSDAGVLSSFGAYYITDWGAWELQEYLKQRFPETWQDQLAKLRSIHDLPELARTPLFLDMIAKTLPELEDPVQPTDLYRVYTDDWIHSQTYRKGALLDSVRREEFVHALAAQLYAENRVSCHYSEFRPILASHISGDNSRQIDYLERDVQTCTFLTRNAAGHYWFKHKSFMEFFASRAILKEVDRQECRLLSARELPQEVAQFLVELMPLPNVLPSLKGWSNSTDNPILRANAISLLGVLDEPVSTVVQAHVGVYEGQEPYGQDTSTWLSRQFEALIGPHRSYLSHLAKSHTIPDSYRDADDIVGDVLLEAWQNKERFTQLDPEEVRPYLKRSVLRLCIRYRPTASPVPLDDVLAFPFEEHAPAFLVTGDSTADSATSRVMREWLENKLDLLPARQAKVLKLRFFLDKTTQEISDDLGLTEADVITLARKGLSKLRRLATES